VAHRDGEDDDRVDITLPLEQVDEVRAPPGRNPAPDHFADPAVGVPGILLGAARATEQAAHPREELALEVAGVRRRPPPGALDRPAAVRGDDQVGAGLVQALPELPPGGRAAVAEVEVDGGRDRQDLG
jgi:hypothetical protein